MTTDEALIALKIDVANLEAQVDYADYRSPVRGAQRILRDIREILVTAPPEERDEVLRTYRREAMEAAVAAFIVLRDLPEQVPLPGLYVRPV